MSTTIQRLVQKDEGEALAWIVQQRKERKRLADRDRRARKKAEAARLTALAQVEAENLSFSIQRLAKAVNKRRLS